VLTGSKEDEHAAATSQALKPLNSTERGAASSNAWRILALVFLAFQPASGWRISGYRPGLATTGLRGNRIPATNLIDSSSRNILSWNQQPLVIDTDMGLDDIATLAAAAVHDMPLVAVTTVAGLFGPGGWRLARRCLDTLGLDTVPVVAGCEDSSRRAIRQWEVGYLEQLGRVTWQLGITPPKLFASDTVTGTAYMAALAIIEAGRKRKVDVLALGALTNLAAMATAHADDFRNCIRRIIIIGSSDGRPYNVRVDPAAMRTVLRAADCADVPVVLIGRQCYAQPSWVEDIFSDCIASDSDAGRKMFAQLGRLEPYSMRYDPLTVFYCLHPEAFMTPEPVGICVTAGENWRMKVCGNEESDGKVVVPVLRDHDKYKAFLRTTSGSIGTKIPSGKWAAYDDESQMLGAMTSLMKAM